MLPTNTLNTSEVQIMIIQADKEKALYCLSKNARLKVRLDEATTLEGKLLHCLQARFIPGVQYFLAQGADPNLPVYGDTNGTAIHFVTSCPQTLMLLLAYGANQNAQDIFGLTIAHNIYSYFGEKKRVYDETEGFEACLQILAQNGANFQLRDKKGHLPEEKVDPGHIEKQRLKLRSLISEGKLVGHANKIDLEYGKVPSLVRLSAASLLKNASAEEVASLCESERLPPFLVEILKGEITYPLPLAEIKDLNERLVASSPKLAEVPLTEADSEMIGFYKRGEYLHLLGLRSSRVLTQTSLRFYDRGRLDPGHISSFSNARPSR